MDNPTLAKTIGQSFNTSEYFEEEMMGCELYTQFLPEPELDFPTDEESFSFEDIISQIKKRNQQKKAEKEAKKNPSFSGDLYKDKPDGTYTSKKSTTKKKEKKKGPIGNFVDGWFKKRKEKKKEKKKRKRDA